MNNQLKAFVGHSFTADDKEIVQYFLKCFDQIADLNIGFSWEHAEAAEPKVLADKVLRLIEDKNLFIGICTNKEAVIEKDKLSRGRFWKKILKAEETAFSSKTSDWIIQEIGLAIGRRMSLILLLEAGIRKPGGLQGNIEYIGFERGSPEKAYGKILEMIKALRLSAKAVLSEQAEFRSAPEEKTDSEEQKEGDWLTPKDEWTIRNYQIALMVHIKDDNNEGIKQISEAFSTSEVGSQPNNRIIWEALEEYYRFLDGKGGKLENLEELAKKYTDNCVVQKYLAQGYLKYDDHDRAAHQFEMAAEKAKNTPEELELYGKAATSFVQGGREPEANAIIAKMKSLLSIGNDGEAILIKTLCGMAEITDDNDTYLGLMERLLQVRPDDTEARFSIAYKYSEINQDELSLFHYLKIPDVQRGSGTWNNLGVGFENCDLVSKSVKAYRKAEELNETLAMANLAQKLIKAGFLEEADETCQQALKVKDYHKKVINAISRIKDIPEEEKAKEKIIVDRAKPLSEFYRDYGRAVLQSNVDKHEGRWQDVNCELDLSIKDNWLVAEGTYEEEQQSWGLYNAMRMQTPAIGTATKKKRYHVKYEGKVFGRAVKAVFTNTPVEEAIVKATLLGVAETMSDVLMILSESLQEIKVLKKGAESDLKFYSLKRID